MSFFSVYNKFSCCLPVLNSPISETNIDKIEFENENY